jgi:hypothetical protein
MRCGTTTTTTTTTTIIIYSYTDDQFDFLRL